MSTRPESVALLGGGVIGAGWAARFVLNGCDVRLYDPAAGAPARAAEVLADARTAYEQLTLAPLRQEGELRIAASIEEAVAGADLVQESAPERVDLKRRLLAEADRAAPPGALICSSTSGLRPSELQADMSRPERFCVAHPFNPVYLLPLVELCGGERTAPEAVDRAAALFGSVGMQPLVVRHEIDGFVADRLLEALWREALWLVNDGVATVEEVDDAIRYGAGLRWAFMGTFLTYRIAGGEAGMRHFLHQFGPTLELPWTHLMDVPELTDELVEKVVEQSDAQAGGRSPRELEQLRDRVLVRLLQALRVEETGAGGTLAAWERDLLGTAPSTPTRRVPPEWVDYNGHVHESRYLELFADATDALLGGLGVDAGYLSGGGSYFTVETHLSHLRQLEAGDRVSVTTQILDSDEKRLHLFHVLLRDGETDPLATAEQMLLHVDTESGRAAPSREPVRERVAELTRRHEELPRPERAGRSVGAR
ncbi:MAG TPA: carnitine 3-dehydrogenase [Gaiellaceae bacterium]|nr:carnitine 3-dehydrogenase [Gaiellaceae bacterium]